MTIARLVLDIISDLIGALTSNVSDEELRQRVLKRLSAAQVQLDGLDAKQVSRWRELREKVPE